MHFNYKMCLNKSEDGGGGEIQVQTCVNPPVEGGKFVHCSAFYTEAEFLVPHWGGGGVMSQLWHRVVDFIPQSGSKNLASDGMGVWDTLWLLTPHPSLSKEQMRLRIVVLRIRDPVLF
jgi:hypothetical protein